MSLFSDRKNYRNAMKCDGKTRFLIFDFETFSELDLKKVGAWEYSKHYSTEILCVAWRLGTITELKKAATRAYAPKLWKENIETDGDFDEFLDALEDPKVVLVAHNAFFERCIVQNVVARRCVLHKLKDIPINRWICTASMAAARALPRDLAGAGSALGLKVQKDAEGKRIMLRMAKPRKPTKHDPSVRHEGQEDFQKLVRYCATDIDVETELLVRLPPLIPTEREVWIIDQEINQTGFRVDRKAVKCALELLEQESARLLARTIKLTGGAIRSTKQIDATKAWLEENGCCLPDLRAKTVKEALESGLARGPAAKLLKIRQAFSKSSTSKYKAFKLRSRSDGRLRDILLYHAAHTARWGGLGLQPQNFPRGTFKETDAAIQLIKDRDLEMLRLCFGDPMAALATCLRGMIIAETGYVLDVADFNAIEVRVLFWLARHEKGIAAFREGRDLYKELAVKIFRRELAKIDGDQRFLGKTATLGCGYQMGDKKFQKSCDDTYGVKIPFALAKAAVAAYREEHKPVTKLWSNLQKAAIAAVKDKTKKYSINRVTFFCSGAYLYCELPSGRRLCYREPEIRYVPSKFDRTKKTAQLTYMGTDSKTKKYMRLSTYGGKLAENICQAIARDLMAAAMIRIKKAGHWRLVLTVHDELLGERDMFSEVGIEDFKRIMSEIPPWAEGCPIKVEGFTSERYRK
jgi:DNA polymerase